MQEDFAFMTKMICVHISVLKKLTYYHLTKRVVCARTFLYKKRLGINQVSLGTENFIDIGVFPIAPKT